MSWSKSLQLTDEFERNYTKLHQRVETANNRHEQLIWENYRKWYESLSKKTKSALRELKNNLHENKNLKALLQNLESSLKPTFDIKTSTIDKWNAIGVADKIWLQFKLELDKQIKEEYDMFRKRDFKVDKKQCFVLMPFDKSFNSIYKEGVKPAVRKTGLKVHRADEIFGSTPIVQDIWEYINKSSLIISELTSRNTNVFYEVGLAHALPKPIIFITQTMDDVPFDLKYIRCIKYENTPKGRKKLNSILYTTIKKMIT